MKYYRVTFLTKKGGEQWWVVDTNGDTAKETTFKIKDLWYSAHPIHMFDIKTRLIKETETFDYHCFTKTDRRV